MAEEELMVDFKCIAFKEIQTRRVNAKLIRSIKDRRDKDTRETYALIELNNRTQPLTVLVYAKNRKLYFPADLQKKIPLLKLHTSRGSFDFNANYIDPASVKPCKIQMDGSFYPGTEFRLFPKDVPGAKPEAPVNTFETQSYILAALAKAAQPPRPAPTGASAQRPAEFVPGP